MLIGVPKEIKTHEYRVGLTPSSVRELAVHGHRVIVETNAGAGIGATDALYERAGADVLFAPALPDLEAVRTVCASLNKPVNFMVAIPGKSFSVAELAAAGVRRISLATSLYRAAMSGLVEAARGIRENGTFDYLGRSISSAEFARLLGVPSR